MEARLVILILLSFAVHYTELYPSPSPPPNSAAAEDLDDDAPPPQCPALPRDIRCPGLTANQIIRGVKETLQPELSPWDYIFSWGCASLVLSAVWFIYAIVNQRWLRNRVCEMEEELCRKLHDTHADSIKGINIIGQMLPATAAYALEKHFRSIRNEEGIMLMKSAAVLLQEKKPRQKKP